MLITGCHPGDCHYVEQNYKTMRRFELLKKTLAQLGIEDGRVKLVWASAAEGMILAEEIDKMVAEVKALGPLNWKAGGLEPESAGQRLLLTRQRELWPEVEAAHELRTANPNSPCTGPRRAAGARSPC